MPGPSYVVPRMPATYQGLPSGRLRPDWDDKIIPGSPTTQVSSFTSENYPSNLVRHTLFYLQNGGFRDPNSPDGFNHEVTQLLENNMKLLGYLPQSHRANGSFDAASLNALTRFTRDHAPGRTVRDLNGDLAGEDARLHDARNWMNRVARDAPEILANPDASRADILYVQYLDMHYGWGNVSSLDGQLGAQTRKTLYGQIHGRNFNTDANNDGVLDISSQVQAQETARETAREEAAARRQADREAGVQNLRAQQAAASRGDWDEVRRLNDQELVRRGQDPAEHHRRIESLREEFNEARRPDIESQLLFVPGVNLGVMMRDPGLNNAVRDTATFVGGAVGTIAEVTLVQPVKTLLTGEIDTRPILGDNSIFQSNETWFREGYNDIRNWAGDIRAGDYHPFRMEGGGSDFRLYRPEDYAEGNELMIVDNTVIPVNGRLSDNRRFELEPSEFPIAVLNRDGSIQRIVTNTGPTIENGVLRNSEWNMYGGSYIAGNIIISGGSLFAAPASLSNLKNATTVSGRIHGALVATPLITESAETIVGIPMLAQAGYEYIKFRFFEDQPTQALPAEGPVSSRPTETSLPEAAAPAVNQPPRILPLHTELSREERHTADMNVLVQVTSPTHLVDPDTGSFDHQKLEQLQELLAQSGRLSFSYKTGTMNIHTMRAIETAVKAAVDPADITQDQQSHLANTARQILTGFQSDKPEADSFDIRVLNFQTNAYFLGIYNGRIDGLAGAATMAAVEQLNAPEEASTPAALSDQTISSDQNPVENLHSQMSRQPSLVLEGP